MDRVRRRHSISRRDALHRDEPYSETTDSDDGQHYSRHCRHDEDVVIEIASSESGTDSDTEGEPRDVTRSKFGRYERDHGTYTS